MSSWKPHVSWQNHRRIAFYDIASTRKFSSLRWLLLKCGKVPFLLGYFTLSKNTQWSGKSQHHAQPSLLIWNSSCTCINRVRQVCPRGFCLGSSAPVTSFTMTSAGCAVRYTLKNLIRWFPSGPLECKPCQVTSPRDMWTSSFSHLVMLRSFLDGGVWRYLEQPDHGDV